MAPHGTNFQIVFEGLWFGGNKEDTLIAENKTRKFFVFRTFIIFSFKTQYNLIFALFYALIFHSAVKVKEL